MKNEVDPKRAIVVIAVVVAIAIGGWFLGSYIMEGSKGGRETVEANEEVSPEPELDAEATPEVEIIRDGIVGVEPEPDPEPTAVPEDTPTESEPTAANSGATPATGSTGETTVTAPVTTPTPTAEPVAPVSTPTPTAAGTNPGTTTTPADGSVNSEGQVYVPGFGWITPGSGNTQTVSHGDGDWNKMVGTMG